MTTNGVFDFQPCDSMDNVNQDEEDLHDPSLPNNQSRKRNPHNQQVEICQQTVNPHCKVSMADFSILRCIGKGGYGKVFLVRKTSPGAHQQRLFAMKVLKKAVICRTEKDMVHTWSERNILEMIRHPFLVKLHYAFQNESNLNMILEYCPGGELFTYLETVGFVSEKKASFYIAEIALAIGHLHSYGIIYRDLKPENILLDRHGHCKLTDFGLSKESCERTNTYCGTKEYMAPEIWQRKFHDKNVDWWCLGNLLYDMLAGYPPFSNEDKNVLREKILHENVEYPSSFSEETVSLLDGLLQKDPSKRLGAGVKDVSLVKAHGFFVKYNICWDDVLMKRVDPPYKPVLRSETDTSQFDVNFTSLPPALSPVDPVPADLFQGFSYVGSGVAESFLDNRTSHEPRYRRRTISNTTSESSSTSDSNDKYSGCPVHFNMSPGDLSEEEDTTRSPFVRAEDFDDVHENAAAATAEELSRVCTTNTLCNGDSSEEPPTPQPMPSGPSSRCTFLFSATHNGNGHHVPSYVPSYVPYPQPQLTAATTNGHSVTVDLTSVPIAIPSGWRNGGYPITTAPSQGAHHRQHHHHHHPQANNLPPPPAATQQQRYS